MIKITLKNGSVIQVPKDSLCIDVCKTISEGLTRAAIVAEINGELTDLSARVVEDCTLNIVTFDDDQGKKTLRHSASHVLAQAVKRLYPKVKLAIGPATESGFYYDFDSQEPFTSEDLLKIESEMKKIIKEKIKIERFTLPRKEALKLMEDRDEPYKIEIINGIADDEVISFYRQGEFVDLCAGTHVLNTGYIKAFKLTSCTGAYFKGDSSRKMLQRIYGTAFMKKNDLEDYLAAVEEAKKRDHNKIGRELEYFTTSEMIGQGLPIILPKGAKVIQILQRFVEDEEAKKGYLLTKTPFMAKSDLYKLSGHWDHYKEGMFIMGDENKDKEILALRPMTCPFQYQVFLNRMRSYRDLPMRLAETSTLFRNESSGEMHGLIRVRQFTISEGHLMCTTEQLEEEFRGCVELANHILDVLGLLEDISYRFSIWDETDRDKYIGTKEQWDRSQSMMKKILDHLGIDYKVGVGEAAFYGPKLDMQIRNVHGKEDTIITIQIDELLAEKFGMEYTAKDGTKKIPCIIHRTSIGCYERTLALLLEKYAGALPLWMSPGQVRIIPVTDRNIEYAQNLFSELKAHQFRVEMDDRSEKVGYKIRQAQLEKVPYMLIVGDKDQENFVVSVRDRKTSETSQMPIAELIEKLYREVETKAR